MMKKLLIVFAAFVAGSSLVSCNKKLKDDISDLKSQVTNLKKENDSMQTALQQQVNGLLTSLGADEPINVTTTFVDDAGTTRTVTGVYKFKASDYSTQKAVKNANGTYTISIARFSAVEEYDYAYVTFTYNPTTKAVTNIDGGHSWNDEDPYSDGTEFYSSYSGAGQTLSVTVDKFDTTTGDISIKFAGAGTAAYTGYVPNYGAPASTNFAFTGKLRIFTAN